MSLFLSLHIHLKDSHMYGSAIPSVMSKHSGPQPPTGNQGYFGAGT